MCCSVSCDVYGGAIIHPDRARGDGFPERRCGAVGGYRAGICRQGSDWFIFGSGVISHQTWSAAPKIQNISWYEYTFFFILADLILLLKAIANDKIMEVATVVPVYLFEPWNGKFKFLVCCTYINSFCGQYLLCVELSHELSVSDATLVV